MRGTVHLALYIIDRLSMLYYVLLKKRLLRKTYLLRKNELDSSSMLIVLFYLIWNVNKDMDKVFWPHFIFKIHLITLKLQLLSVLILLFHLHCSKKKKAQFQVSFSTTFCSNISTNINNFVLKLRPSTKMKKVHIFCFESPLLTLQVSNNSTQPKIKVYGWGFYITTDMKEHGW